MSEPQRGSLLTIRAHMQWVRIPLVLLVLATTVATMVAETISHKLLAGCIGSVLIGLLWALLLRHLPRYESAYWNQLSINANEAQRIIDQHPYWKLFRQKPELNTPPIDIQGAFKSPLLIGLLISIGMMLGFDESFRSYVLDFSHPLPPRPKTLLLYFGFLLCLSVAFAGLFLRAVELFLRHKQAISSK